MRRRARAMPGCAAAARRCAGRRRRAAGRDYYGTAEPFASEAVYFVLTDRFVNGDPANDQREQGGANRTFDRPLTRAERRARQHRLPGRRFPRHPRATPTTSASMGFTAVWITPIVDNPDEAFTGGFRIGEAFFADRGKTGYHGYWGVNFYRVDEHLESAGLALRGLHAPHARRARPQGRARHRRQPRLALVHDARRPAEVRRDLRPRRQAGGRSSEPAAGEARPGESAAPLLPPRARPGGAVEFRRHEPGGDGLPRRAPTCNGSTRARAHSGSTPSATCRTPSGASSRRASARGTRASSCSASTSSTTRAKIAAHMLPGERRRQRARLSRPGGDGRRCSPSRTATTPACAKRCTSTTASTAIPTSS